MRRLIAFLVTLAACGDSTSSIPTPHVVVGVIDAGGTLDAALAGPSSGQVGEKLLYTVTTYGSGCYRAAGAGIINQGVQMTIVPYDSIVAGDCTDDLRPLPRTVEIIFDRSGDATLRLQGQSITGRNPVVVTRALQIRP